MLRDCQTGGENDRLGAGAYRGSRRRLRHSISAVGPKIPSTEAVKTDDGRVVFDMRAEIAERIGMATFDDGIGFRRERAHSGAPSERERMRQVPASGTSSQPGRCASSY